MLVPIKGAPCSLLRFWGARSAEHAHGALVNVHSVILTFDLHVMMVRAELTPWKQTAPKMAMWTTGKQAKMTMAM